MSKVQIDVELPTPEMIGEQLWGAFCDEHARTIGGYAPLPWKELGESFPAVQAVHVVMGARVREWLIASFETGVKAGMSAENMKLMAPDGREN